MPSGLKPGDAIWMRFPHSDQPKNKICLCICSEDNIFLIISSEPYSWAPADSQITIYKSELGILSKDSQLDVSKYYDDFSLQEIGRGIQKGAYPLSDSARSRIKHCVQNQRYLIERVKKKILANL